MFLSPNLELTKSFVRNVTSLLKFSSSGRVGIAMVLIEGYGIQVTELKSVKTKIVWFYEDVNPLIYTPQT